VVEPRLWWGLSHKIVVTGKSVIAINRVMMESSKRKQRTIPYSSFSEKNLTSFYRKVKNFNISVPQTDTGGLVEYTKAIGRKRFKELGKSAWRNLWEMPYPAEGRGHSKRRLPTV
jgi:hypothetical protein